MQIRSFADFEFVPPIGAALAGLGFAVPTPIQAASIAAQIAGRDLIGRAATGSGKTGAFILPLLHRLIAEGRRAGPGTCRALVLAPTRELALQIVQAARDFAGAARVASCLVVGGVPRGRQTARLAGGVDLVVATPGRLIDLLGVGAIRLDATRHLVIDEADRMLDLGFLDPVRRIAAALAPERQTVMFSATLPEPVLALAEQLLRDPVRVAIDAPPDRRGRVAARAELVAPRAKRRRLLAILGDPAVTRAIVFCRTRKGADRLAGGLCRDGLAVAVIHGQRSQEERLDALGAFRRGERAVLVATDIVARGIDVPGVSHVVNYDLPEDIDGYIHRIGRTGRNGAEGTAITLCTPDDLPRLRAIERRSGGPLLPRPCRACRPGEPGTGCDRCTPRG